MYTSKRGRYIVECIPLSLQVLQFPPLTSFINRSTSGNAARHALHVSTTAVTMGGGVVVGLPEDKHGESKTKNRSEERKG